MKPKPEELKDWIRTHCNPYYLGQVIDTVEILEFALNFKTKERQIDFTHDIYEGVYYDSRGGQMLVVNKGIKSSYSNYAMLYNLKEAKKAFYRTEQKQLSLF